MMFDAVMDRFVEQSPASVMFRGTLENVVTPALLDEMFAQTAKRQKCGQLLFSSVVDLLALVATGSRKSVNDAYKARKEQFTVSVTSVYNKLNGVESEVSRQMVRQTAMRMAEVVQRLSPRREPLLRGYRTKIIDGNHLAATEHRIEELRTIGSGPLPGLALVVLEPDRMLVSDVFPWEDGHAQERKILPLVLPTVQAHDLWIADRNFCTRGFVCSIADRGAAFVIRQHKQNLPYELVGERRKIGRCPTGMLYEQKMRVTDEKGKTRDLRRVTIVLKKPTRDGETEIHLLTNLPAKVANARRVADLYLHRWTVEKAFHELDQALHGEIKTLGYPGAALLSFCVALLAYNVISVVKSAIAAAHGAAAKRETISGYYLAGELAAAYHGMMIAVPAAHWTRHFASLTPAELASILKMLAAKVHPDRFRKNIRGPKKPPPKRSSAKQHPHVSTARILAQRKQPQSETVLA
jgi:Transposase DDE domain